MTNDPANLEPDGLGELKSIKRIPGMLKHAPTIRWGDDYHAKPVEERLKYAEKLASSMNHAADILQTERNKVIEVAHIQEEQIRQLQRQVTQQNELTQQIVARANTEKQQLNKTIVDVQTALKAANGRIKLLEK